jgi:hypothetical protein
MTEVMNYFRESSDILCQENKWKDILLQRQSALIKETSSLSSLRHSQAS